MGVQGLTTFVEGNKFFLQDVKFRDSRILIDGSSLYFSLYFNYGLDQPHGGDYDAFYSVLMQFFSALEACNIQPFVVLDGGMDPSEKKFNTIRQRLQSKIKDADGLCHGRHGCVLPLLTKQTFIQALVQSGVPLVQCPTEADWEIACLARQWNCPVLSRDSDFYIFDLPGGYFSFNHFQWSNVKGKAKQCYISARRYTLSALCRRFGLNKELLPLFAVLTGNDYCTPREAERLRPLLDMNIAERSNGKKKGLTPAASRIEMLLVWLSSFSGPAEALAEISQLVQENVGSVLSSKLQALMQEYNIKCLSPLALWFSHEKQIPECWTHLELPECLVKSAAQGLLSASVVDAFVMKRVMLIPQVENGRMASSHCSAKSIRQFMYGIILQTRRVLEKHSGKQEAVDKGEGGEGKKSARKKQGQGGGAKGQMLPVKGKGATVHSEGSVIQVEEYDRMDLTLKKTLVEIHLLKKPLCLDTIDQVSSVDRTAVLLEILGVTEPALISVPLHWRLAVAVTAFWQQEAKPKPTPHQLQALLMGFVYGELNLRRTGLQEVELCADMVRRRIKPGQRGGLDLQNAHCYSQWQACLWAALCLNQLLLRPMSEPSLSWSFSGTLVHGLVKYLKDGRAPESLLHRSSFSTNLYSSFLAAVNECVSKGRPASGRGKRARRRKRKGPSDAAAARGNRATDKIHNRFALLMSEEDDDDEE